MAIQSTLKHFRTPYWTQWLPNLMITCAKPNKTKSRPALIQVIRMMQSKPAIIMAAIIVAMPISKNTSSMKISLSLSTAPAFKMLIQVLSLPSRGSETYMSREVHPPVAIRIKLCKAIKQHAKSLRPLLNSIKVQSHSLSRRRLWPSFTSARQPCRKRQWFKLTPMSKLCCLRALISSSSQRLSDHWQA